MKSRYENISITKVKGKETITSAAANVNREIPLNEIRTRIIKYNGKDRIDQLAEKYLGDARHWWVICKINNLYGNFWRIAPQANLLIPENVNDILDYF